MSRFILATDDQRFEQRVRSALGSANGDLRLLLSANRVTPDVLSAIDLADIEQGAEVVAIGPGLSPRDALSLAEQFTRERPEISVLIVAPPSALLWERALQVGARGVVAPDSTGPELQEAFSRASLTAQRLRQNLRTEPDPLRRRIIAVVSPKGGAGKTTIASNLAVALSQEAPNQVALVDGDVQFGDIAAVLGLSPAHTVADAAAALPDLDLLGLKVFLEPHPSSLYALCGADSPANGERVGSHELEQIVGLLSQNFPYVVVDTSAGLTEHTLSVLEHCTDVVVVCGMDVPTLRAMSKQLHALDELHMTQPRHLVLNRSDSRVGMTAADVEATLGSTIDIGLPSSRSVPLSVNNGTAIIEAEPNSRIAREFRSLAARFMPAGASVPRGRSGRRRSSE